MTIRYSASARGFFNIDLHQAIPADAVTVSARRYAQLLAAQADGAEIVPDHRGRPSLSHPAAPTVEEARAACVHAIKREAARRIDARLPLWKQINALRENRDPGFHEIDAIRQASNLIEEQLLELQTSVQIAGFPVSDHPIWPTFEAGKKNDA